MNIPLMWRECMSVALTGILFLSFVSARLLAGAIPDASPQCKMQLTNSASTMLGEPINIHATIMNPSEEQKLWIQTGLYQNDWYTLDLVDQWGHQVVPIRDTRTREPNGVHATGITVVQPSGSVPIDIVVTHFLPILHPGKYTLTVHVRARYTQMEFQSEDMAQARGQIRSGQSILTGIFVFPLVISPANPFALQRKAEALKQAISNEPVGKSYNDDLDALFSMPEAVTRTAWQELADGGNSAIQEVVATKLEELHSITASDILVRMLDNSAQAIPGPPSMSKRLIGDCLHRMYNDGSSELHEHIKSVYAQRGIQIPEKADIPQIID